MGQAQPGKASSWGFWARPEGGRWGEAERSGGSFLEKEMMGAGACRWDCRSTCWDRETMRLGRGGSGGRRGGDRLTQVSQGHLCECRFPGSMGTVLAGEPSSS